MIEAGQNVAFLDRRSQPFVEPVLRAVVHDPIGAGDQELRRHGDGARVGDHARGRLVEAEQDVDRDRAGDQRIGAIGGDALGIVGEELRLDVGIDEKVPTQPVLQREAGARERNVQLHLEGGRRQHHATNFRGVVVHPDRDQHRAHALRDHRHALDRNCVALRNVPHEGVDVAHRRAEAWAEAALAGRAAMTARVPGEHGEVGQIELVGEMRHAAGMLVAAVEQDDCALGRRRGGRPIAVEQVDAVMGAERLLIDLTHASS